MYSMVPYSFHRAEYYIIHKSHPQKLGVVHITKKTELPRSLKKLNCLHFVQTELLHKNMISELNHSSKVVQ